MSKVRFYSTRVRFWIYLSFYLVLVIYGAIVGYNHYVSVNYTVLRSYEWFVYGVCLVALPFYLRMAARREVIEFDNERRTLSFLQFHEITPKQRFIFEKRIDVEIPYSSIVAGYIATLDKFDSKEFQDNLALAEFIIYAKNNRAQGGSVYSYARKNPTFFIRLANGGSEVFNLLRFSQKTIEAVFSEATKQGLALSNRSNFTVGEYLRDFIKE